VTQLLVPSQYATIASAITAAGSGDVIILSAGTYSEHINLSSKTNVVLRAAFGEAVVINCVLSSDVAVNVANSSGVVLRDLTFRLTGSTMGSLVFGNAATGLKVIQCTFDVEAVTGGDTADGLLYLTNAVGTSTNPIIVSRCKFLGTPDYALGYGITIGATGALHAVVEGCLFYRVRANTNSTNSLIRVTWTTLNANVYVRHNTFVRCKAYKRFVYFSSSSTTPTLAVMHNMLVDECTVSTPTSATAAFDAAVTGSTTYIRDIRYYHGTSGTSLTYAQAFNGTYADATDCLVNSDPAVADGSGAAYTSAVGRITTTSPAYRGGTTAAATERSARLGEDRLPFATTPSQGCYEVYPTGLQAFHVKHKFTNPISGITLTHGGAVTLTGTTRSFEDPFEVAEFVEVAFQDGRPAYAPIDFWYMPTADHRYRAAVVFGTFDLTTSGIAGTIMGSGSHAGSSDTG